MCDPQTPPPAQSSANKNTKTPPGNAHVVSPIRKTPGEAEQPRLSPDNVVVLKRGGDKTKPPNVTPSPSESPVLHTSPGVHSVERNLESSPKAKLPVPCKTHSNKKTVETVGRHNGDPTKESSEKAIAQEVPAAKFDSSPTQPSSSPSNAARATPNEATAGTFADQARRGVQDFTAVAGERTPLCIHSKTISSIQLQHMLLQKNMAEYQQELIREAMTSLRETKSEQQFFFITDFYHNLLEENRRTNGLYCDVTLKTLEAQQIEHRLDVLKIRS